MIFSSSIFANYFDQHNINHGRVINLCYLSLDSTREFNSTKDYFKKLNTSKPFVTNVYEFQDELRSTKKNFIQMIESGLRCDGLIVSGLYGSNFTGKRSQNSLDFNFLAELAHHKDYSKWFTQVEFLRMNFEKLPAHLEIEPNDLPATIVQENSLKKKYLQIFPNALLFEGQK